MSWRTVKGSQTWAKVIVGGKKLRKDIMAANEIKRLISPQNS